MSLSGTGSDPRRWREWAGRARSIAELMKTETSRQTMNEVADMYDRAADRNENRATHRKIKPPTAER
jgi:hypothetical protein